MPHAGFVHLRVHSAYSLSEGALRLKDLVKTCRDQCMPAVAVTDSGNLFGALEFALTAEAAGIQPIIGCQIGLTVEDAQGRNGAAPAPDQLVLLVQDETGYRNLMKLVSRAFLEGDPGLDPQVTLEELASQSDGLLALTGGPAGPVGRLIRARRPEAAEALLGRLIQAFPGRLYVELQRHGLPSEAETEGSLLDMAYRHDLPLVATNDAYFPDVGIHQAHDVLLCIAEGRYVNEQDRRRLTPDHRLKTAEEMRELFADLPEAVDNTLVVARRCACYPAPVAPILPAYPSEAGRGEGEELRAQATAGLEQRLEAQVYGEEMDAAAREAAAKPYRDRLDYELGVIEQMGFPGYFLIVAEFIQWAKAQDIPVGPGRGSGAGSVVAWALTITNLDPLRWGLLFERFLNPERVSMPDFDVDFCQDRRDEVIRHVQELYGRDRVAQIITFGKLQARAALRDVGRVLQMPFGQVDRICKLVPNNPANPVTLAQAIAGEPQLQHQRDTDETVGRMIDIALKLEGLYRHASTHAAGVVIGDRPLDELVPLYRDPRSDMPVTQFNMKYVEQAGLVKFDFLGLKTLSVLARAQELIRERVSDFDLDALPLDDPGTFEMLGRAETVGVFQLESSGMRDVLRRLKPDRFEDIIAVVALYRPGPMDNIPSYINRKHGEEQPDYLYPTLEGILKETFGIMIYQEQVMQIAQELAGYSLGGADLLRRAMGKKIKSEMEAQRESFVEGAMARGVPKGKAAEIFEQVNKFAGYGFNKSHAAAYALVAYQTAFLKANYPVEFLAASMTYDMNNTDKLNVFKQELDRLGVPLLGPDVNRSRADFSVERDRTGADGEGAAAIRYALAAVKNVGEAAMEALVAERDTSGSFRDLADLAGRIDTQAINKRQLESLACAGAFDSLHENRHQVFQGAELLIRNAAVAASERDSAQDSLFGGDDGALAIRLDLPPVEDWPPLDRLRQEFDAIGFYLSAHPLDAYEEALNRLKVLRYTDLENSDRETPGFRKLAGIVVGKQERTSRTSQNRFAFVQLTDSSGVFEVVIFHDLLTKTRELLEAGQALLLTVDVRRDNDSLRLMAQEIQVLDQAVEKKTNGIKVFLKSPAPLCQIRGLLERQTGGRGRVNLVLDLEDGREVELVLPPDCLVSPALRQAVKAVPGIDVRDL